MAEQNKRKRVKKEILPEHKNLGKEATLETYNEKLKALKKLQNEVDSLSAATKNYKANERKQAAIYGSFVMKKKRNEYEQDITSVDFKKFLNRNIDRELFGLELLPTIEIKDASAVEETLKKIGSIKQAENIYSIPEDMDKAEFERLLELARQAAEENPEGDNDEEEPL